MEIILNEDIATLGYKNDIVKVKSGFARNYLIPKGMAKVANVQNRKIVAEVVKQQAAKLEKVKAEMNALKEKIEAATIKIGAKAGTSGKIFGSVTNIQIADALKEQFGIELDRKKIKIIGEVKDLGTYQSRVELYKDIIAESGFEVVAE